VVRNESDARVEVVLSVDGLDVIDGRSASYRKRGYIIPPRGRINVDGFRQSMSEVAAFRFGSSVTHTRIANTATRATWA
jgi:hypothetical protein